MKKRKEMTEFGHFNSSLREAGNRGEKIVACWWPTATTMVTTKVAEVGRKGRTTTMATSHDHGSADRG